MAMTSAERTKRWRLKYPEKHAARQARWLAKHPGTCYEVTKRYRKKNPLALRESIIKAKYGITNKIYNDMLLINKGGCWICGKLPKTKRLSIDHDHSSGQVRGLLCYQCNRRLIGRSRREHSWKYLAAYL